MDISDSSYIDDLEQEIRYLHELLDINGIPYDYQAYKETAYILSQPGIMEDIRQGEADIEKGNVTALDFDELQHQIDTAGKA